MTQPDALKEHEEALFDVVEGGEFWVDVPPEVPGLVVEVPCPVLVPELGAPVVFTPLERGPVDVPLTGTLTVLVELTAVVTAVELVKLTADGAAEEIFGKGARDVLIVTALYNAINTESRHGGTKEQNSRGNAGERRYDISSRLCRTSGVLCARGGHEGGDSDDTRVELHVDQVWTNAEMEGDGVPADSRGDGQGTYTSTCMRSLCWYT
jgi:hypothetical protein